MKLYFHPFSGNSRRVLLVAAHLEIPLEHVVIDLVKGEQRGAAHLARQPNGVVPVLEDDGFLLWESRAIMEYLCDRTPGQELLPTDLRGRADVHRWLFWDAVHMSAATAVLGKERFVKQFRNLPPDPAEEKRGEELVAQYAPVLDAHLAKKTWIAEDRVTLADYSIACAFMHAAAARLPLEPHRHLRSWLGRVHELPAWQKTQPAR